MKRSYQRIETRESKILRYMRQSKDLSMRAAGRLVNLSDSTINHYEHGRLDISQATTARLVEGYGYTMADFEEFMRGREIPENTKDECIALLNRIDDAKLRAVHAVLTSFTR